MEHYSRRQVRLLIALFVAYTAAYISRTNLAPTLGAIQTHFGLTAAQVGLLPTLFAVPYAVGQIINGTLADHFRARNFILIGLVGSAIINITFSFSTNYSLLLILWAINGCFQSMIWTPIVRILAVDFHEAVRARAMFLMSTTLIVGYLAAWLLSGMLTSYFSWQWAYRVSGIITGTLGIASFFALGGEEGSGIPQEAKEAEAAAAPTTRVSLVQLVFGTDLALLLLGCIFNGYVRDSIMNWAPTMLQQTQGIDLNGAMGVVLVIPIINFVGIQLGKFAYEKMHNDVRRSSILMMAIGVVAALLLIAVYKINPWICTALLAASSAMAYSLNPLLTSVLPMDYQSLGRVGMAAGLIDALIYVGSAFSGTFVGWLLDSMGGWSAVFASWAVFNVVGILMFVLAMHKKWTVGKRPY